MAEEIRYTVPEAPAAEDPRGFLLVGDKVHIIPALPEVKRPPSDDRVGFKGPLVAALYGGTYLGPRVKGIIRSTLARNPDYFTQLGARIRATNSLAPTVIVRHALDNTIKKPKAVPKRRT